jgi:hypothetical protein
MSMMLINLKSGGKQSLYANEMANFQLESLITKTFTRLAKFSFSTALEIESFQSSLN